MKTGKVLLFLGGTATGLFLTTKACRKAAVHAVAGGLLAKDRILEEATNIREDAMDIYEDAKAKVNETREAEAAKAGEVEKEAKKAAKKK